jgi:hypothetical protein
VIYQVVFYNSKGTSALLAPPSKRQEGQLPPPPPPPPPSSGVPGCCVQICMPTWTAVYWMDDWCIALSFLTGSLSFRILQLNFCLHAFKNVLKIHVFMLHSQVFLPNAAVAATLWQKHLLNINNSFKVYNLYLLFLPNNLVNMIKTLPFDLYKL